MSEFTITEIFLIKSCNTNNMKQCIKVLKGYSLVDFGDSDMKITIKNVLKKLQEMTTDEFIALRNYPL